MSGCFLFFQGVFRVFPHPLCGDRLWTLPKVAVLFPLCLDDRFSEYPFHCPFGAPPTCTFQEKSSYTTKCDLTIWWSSSAVSDKEKHQTKKNRHFPPKKTQIPPKTRIFMGMEVFLQKECNFLGAHKIGAAIFGPCNCLCMAAGGVIEGLLTAVSKPVVRV